MTVTPNQKITAYVFGYYDYYDSLSNILMNYNNIFGILL